MIPGCHKRMSRKQCTYCSRSSAAGTINPEQSVNNAGISGKSRNDQMKIDHDPDTSSQQKYPSRNIKLIFQASLFLSNS